MSLQITISAAKKLPHPTHQFGSISAQVSLVGEASSLAEAPIIMRDLFAAAQAGCDQHLAMQAGAPVQSSPVRSVSPSPSASRPAPRRGMPPISDAQRRLLDRLLQGDPQRVEAVCQRFHVATVGELTVKTASECIDWLRVPA